MTAREKFEARLKELGLYDEWMSCSDKVGKVMEDGSIVILIHYDWEKDDPYNEIHYPSFDKLWENENFRKECMSDFFEHDDDKFVAGLARWLQYGPGCGYECPLFPVDVHLAASGLETEVIEFKDDPAPDPERLTNIIRELAEMCGITLA